MATEFFDLHFHPIFKKYITYYEAHFPTRRDAEEMEGRINLKNFITKVADDLFLHILQSQSAVKDCLESNTRIGVAALANLEFGFAASKGFMADILKSDMTQPLKKIYFDMVKNGEISYYRMMLKELDLYRSIAKQDKRVQMICRKTQKSLSAMRKDARFRILISLEGGHNLYRLKVGQTRAHDSAAQFGAYDQEDSFTQSMNKGPSIGIDPVKSLQDFMQLLWDNEMDMLYITITHLTHIPEQFIATQAYGLKLLQHPAFFPMGNGISPMGFDLIKACSDMKLTDDEGKKVKAPVLIDIKHLGLKSRQDLYQFRKENKITLPLVASHMGVTGYTQTEWKAALHPKKCRVHNSGGVKSVEILTERKRCGKWGSFINNEFTFNPWSINMMDDDIVEVLESDGLIGVSADVRILGFQSKIGLGPEETSEYLSTSDFQTHFPLIQLKNLPVDTPEEAFVKEESWLIPTKEERHPISFCFNIIHIVNVGLLRCEKINPWDHICVGTDYDGLIEPMKICYNITAIGDLEYNLLKWLPTAAKAYYEENGGAASIQEEVNNLPRLKEIVKKIMYANGERFVNNWMKGSPGASIGKQKTSLTTSEQKV